jgi:hypothetical protein
MEVKSIPTKTFKEVHEELENESLFLDKNHDINDFRDKANFLYKIGFTNSIATKIYDAISENASVIQDYKNKYHGIYKFILKPQLERVCEKYNLYVRDTKFFLGDIPEKNIKDMMNFQICIDDLPIDEDEKDRIIMSLFGVPKRHLYFGTKAPMICIDEFSRFPRLSGLIEIASIKSLFSDKAFERSNERIINTSEIEPKNQVDLDPIVLCRTKHGYLIITAWGDEANDELVVNENLN